MVYSRWNFELLMKKFQLTLRTVSLFPDVEPVLPDDWLQESLRRNRALSLISEKSRSEFIVAPILSSVRTYLKNEFYIYSGMQLNIDPAAGLQGECDFILARTLAAVAVLSCPLLMIVEAKKQDFDEGLPQCAAQLLGARKFNEKHGNPDRILYGSVTTGSEWLFLRLTENEIQINPDRYQISNLSQILGVLVAILKGSTKP